MPHHYAAEIVAIFTIDSSCLSVAVWSAHHCTAAKLYQACNHRVRILLLLSLLSCNSGLSHIMAVFCTMLLQLLLTSWWLYLLGGVGVVVPLAFIEPNRGGTCLANMFGFQVASILRVFNGKGVIYVTLSIPQGWLPTELQHRCAMIPSIRRANSVHMCC